VFRSGLRRAERSIAERLMRLLTSKLGGRRPMRKGNPVRATIHLMLAESKDITTISILN
jgi:hypothetical protein